MQGQGERNQGGQGQGGRPGGGEGRQQGGQRGAWANRGGDGSKESRAPRTQQIWVLDADRNLKSVTVTLGLNDNRYVELAGGELKEGDEVVIGFAAAETASAPNQQNNPFGPRGMGGPGGGGGGGGRGR
jgi:hypothetical protein